MPGRRGAGAWRELLRGRAVLACAVIACIVALPLQAAPANALDAWLDGVHSLRAGFTQTVKDAQGKTTEQSSGELLVLRPGRFRWESHAGTSATDSGQLLVADGRSVWFYDRDLQQVTVKPADAALSSTPIMLLSGSASVRSAFDVTAAGSHDGLDWVRVKPRAGEADFRQALLGFGGGDLKQMVLEDKLGQVATLVFDHAQRNAAVTEAEVSFTVPAGVDVIGKVPQ